MNLATIPAHLPFLDTLARRWLAEAGNDPSGGMILLPTRRARRALTEAFLRIADGAPLLLPRIASFGTLGDPEADGAPLALAGALDLPPAVEPQLRLAVLTRMVNALDGKYGAPAAADRGWPLAAELARLLDEVARMEIPNFPGALRGVAGAGYAEHWERTIEFLEIVTTHWPLWLRDEGLLDIAERGVRLLDLQRQEWEANPPGFPVWVAGTTGGIPSVARMLRAVAGLDRGWVVLPGLDLGADAAEWDRLGEAMRDSHPQMGMRRLLAELGARRDDVRVWDGDGVPGPDAAAADGGARVGARPGVPEGRAAALLRALLPESLLSEWRRPGPLDTAGLMRLAPADQQEEAMAIALVLREALERPGARAALVTPDRDLAVRVSAELLRFGVVADDSAGEKLAETPPGAFLRLLALAVAEELPPARLLGLLKHPLAALGLPVAECRRGARALELACLRGPKPAPGIAGLRAAVEAAEARVAEARMADRADAARPAAAPGSRLSRARDLLDRLEACLAPIAALLAQPEARPDEALAALVRAAEAVAATDTEAGAARLWSGEEGEALATHLSALQQSLPWLKPQPIDTLPGLLDSAMEGCVVRGRRALRGRAAGTEEHPRVFIWGLLEARLQSVDVIVLGGLAETVWPPATDPGPWMSRPMRAQVGLPSPEERIGQMAHDFVQTACAAPLAILSCPRRRDGAPAVPARWLVRLEAMLRGRGAETEGAGMGDGSGRSAVAAGLPEHPAALWARKLDLPDGPPRPVRPPAPRPPVELRPRRLRVTEIETWLRDPYAIYARHVLRLEALAPLEQSPDAADYGIIVHDGMARFLREAGTRFPADARDRLRRAMDEALDAARLRPALAAWWRPRLRRIADWIAEHERDRRAERSPAAIAFEVMGDWTFDCPSGPFRLRGRADRIERRADGTLAILDYKTGTPPAQKEVEAGLAPQLLLEAAMAADGAFPGVQGEAAELTYWHLTGGFVAGDETTLFGGSAQKLAEVIATAKAQVCRLAGAFDDPAQPYLSRPDPRTAPRFSDYVQLARAAEWAAAED